MSSSVQVILDNYDNACFPGQTIAGRVECFFHSEKNVRGIRVKFTGRAETEWHESERYYDHHSKQHRSRTVRYFAEETYFYAEYNLLQGGESFVIPPGKHTYPFSYILPPQLPSSFEAGYGNIRYHIKATVDRPWKFDYESILALNLVSPLDLNFLPDVRIPIATSVDKTMCSCWCNDSGALTFNLSVPAAGFVPGQEVHVGAYVQNMTNVNVENVKFKIVGALEFITHHPSTRRRYDEKTIAGCLESGVGAHGEKSWTAIIPIPANQPYPNLIPCSIINLTYSLQAEVVVPCPHTNLDSQVAVMIGTVPLAGVTTTFAGDPPPQAQFPGFTSEGTPLLPNATVPYPPGGSPYPSGDAKYPPDNNMPYPSGGGAPYPPPVAPYPPGGNSNNFGDSKNPVPPGVAPYPAGGNAFPPTGGTPYPPAGEKSPSGPPSAYGEKSPSGPPGGAPYPSGGTPYPPPGASGPSAPPPSGGALYPPGGSPYPSGGSPYPSGGAPYPPGGASSASAPPSYDEIEKPEKS